jgi:hypothetical protein
VTDNTVTSEANLKTKRLALLSEPSLRAVQTWSFELLSAGPLPPLVPCASTAGPGHNAAENVTVTAPG